MLIGGMLQEGVPSSRLFTNCVSDVNKILYRTAASCTCMGSYEIEMLKRHGVTRLFTGYELLRHSYRGMDLPYAFDSSEGTISLWLLHPQWLPR
jgi:hypothetical protein